MTWLGAPPEWLKQQVALKVEVEEEAVQKLIVAGMLNAIVIIEMSSMPTAKNRRYNNYAGILLCIATTSKDNNALQLSLTCNQIIKQFSWSSLLLLANAIIINKWRRCDVFECAYAHTYVYISIRIRLTVFAMCGSHKRATMNAIWYLNCLFLGVRVYLCVIACLSLWQVIDWVGWYLRLLILVFLFLFFFFSAHHANKFNQTSVYLFIYFLFRIIDGCRELNFVALLYLLRRFLYTEMEKNAFKLNWFKMVCKRDRFEDI